MHQRNVLLIAMTWAAAVLVLMLLPIGLDKTELAGLLYFPAIVVALLLSGGAAHHAPDAGAMWSAAAVWSLMYWWLVLVFYALLLEYYLLRSAVRHMLRTQPAAGLTVTTPTEHLDAFGQALDALERRRRKQWVLAAAPGIHLGPAPVDLASAALGGGTATAPGAAAGPAPAAAGPTLTAAGAPGADPGTSAGAGVAAGETAPPALATALLRHYRRGLAGNTDATSADAAVAAMHHEARRRQGRAR